MPREVLRCVGEDCTNPVKIRARGQKRAWSLGRRIVDGVEWCWYCSRACSGRRAGTQAAMEDRHVKNFDAMAEGRMVAAQKRRHAEFQPDVVTLQRYGVGRDLAIAILDRVYARGEVRGYNRAYQRFRQKERAA